MVAYRKNIDNNLTIQVIVGPLYSEPKEFGLLSYNYFMVEILNITSNVGNGSVLTKEKYTRLGLGWLESMSKYNDKAATFVNLTKADLSNIESQLTSKSSTPIVLSTKKIEKPCISCKKPNDMGATPCWWCGTDNPTK